MGEERKYALRIPRGIATGIVFEAAEKFGLEVDQEKQSDDGYDPASGLPVREYVPHMIIQGDSPEQLLAAQEYIYKRHEAWIEGIEEWRKRRHEQSHRKIRE